MDSQELIEAARNGNDGLVAKLLAEQPDLKKPETPRSVHGEKTALHWAAEAGHETVVARLLAACPGSTNITRCCQNALHLAAANGHSNVVALLLAAKPSLAYEVNSSMMNALHVAASREHEDVVAQLLVVMYPSSITSKNLCGETVLSYAVARGRNKIVTQLLAAFPELIHKDDTILHIAAAGGHDDVVAHILALRPELISRKNSTDGGTPLIVAVKEGHQHIAERLLAIKPAAVFDVSTNNYNVLHAATRKCSREFVEKLWRMHPDNLRSFCCGFTPFHSAIFNQRDDLVELFQLALSFEEIMSAFTHFGCEERYRSMMEKLWECLLGCLNRDVAGIVFQYLGVEPSHRG